MSAGSGHGLAVIVLAAGRGTRFPGVPSKVLVRLAGVPLIQRVLASVRALGPARILAVVGHGREAVTEVLGADVEPVNQERLGGTGHAVLVAGEHLGATPRDLLVVNGDVPLVSAETLRALIRARERGAAAAILTAVLAEGGAYGRVLRRPDGSVAGIVEARDATPEELLIREINVGAYVFRWPELRALLEGASAGNAQGEIYLTDAVRALVERGEPVHAVTVGSSIEARGVNTPEELESLERELREG